MSDVGTTRSTGFALPPAAASKQVTVYHAQPRQIAAAMRKVDDVMDKTLTPLAQKRKDVSVITDNWGVPLLGLPLAAGVAMFFDAGLVPWAIAGASAAISTVGGILHPFLRRRAVAAAPSLLQGDARDDVLKLAEARTAFANGEGGKVEAPELDLFVAKKASATLERIKNDSYCRTDDPEIIALLEKYAAATATLSPEDQQVFEFISKCIEKRAVHEVPALFDALPAALQYELGPFVREELFDDDHPRVGHRGDRAAFTALFHKIESMHPRLTVPYATTPEHTPAKIADRGNLIQTLGNLADIDEKLDLRTAQHNESFSPAMIQEAVALAISNDRTGVERALVGKLVQRQLERMDEYGVFAYRVRAAFADLLATANAEPLSVRERADKIMTKIDHISRGIPVGHRSRNESVPALDLRQIISFLEVIELMNLK